MGAVGGAIGGILGGVAGGQASQSGQSSNSLNRVYLAPESELEKAAREAQQANFSQFGNLVNAGANQQDVSQAAGSQRSLADLLQSFSQGGYQPTAQDTQNASNLADQLFAPSFRQQGIEANRMAARLGRPINDPIIQSKLRQAQAEQRGTFVAQQAQQAPLQRLGFASQLSDVRNNLASQALANRQAILGVGNTILSNQQQFRLGTATRESNSDQSQSSGGGFGGALTGAIGGIGSGLSLGSQFGKLFGGGSSAPKINSAGGSYSNFGSYA